MHQFASLATLLLSCALILMPSAESGAEPDSSAGVRLTIETNNSQRQYSHALTAQDKISCTLTSPGTKAAPLQRQDCLVAKIILTEIEELRNQAAEQNKKLADSLTAIAEKQTAQLKLVMDSALLAAASTELAKSLSVAGEETARSLSKLDQELGQNIEENKKFIAALVEQYKQLNARIDKSIPNFKD